MNHVVFSAGAQVGNRTRIGPFVVIKRARIGEDVQLLSGVVIEDDVIIFDKVVIGSNSVVGEKTLIESGVFLGACVTINPLKYIRAVDLSENVLERAAYENLGIIIESRVVIGANTTVIGNVVIGANSVIGAGSVVLCDIPPNEIWAGNPAKKIRDITGTEWWELT